MALTTIQQLINDIREQTNDFELNQKMSEYLSQEKELLKTIWYASKNNEDFEEYYQHQYGWFE